MTDYIATDTELTSVANAIRTKGGTNAQLEWPTEYISAVNNISTASPDDDVLFIDYDGTILHSYSAQQFLALTQMPPNPDRTSEGLTSQGWNWNLTDAKAQVSACGKVDIGQTYIPTDGKTHLFVEIPDDDISDSRVVSLRMKAVSSTYVDFDWGDGTVESKSPSTSTSSEYSHTYSNSGTYEIKLSPRSASISVQGQSGYYNFFGQTGSGNNMYYSSQMRLKKIHFGNNIVWGSGRALQDCIGLEYITIPNSMTSFGGYEFNSCFALKNVIYPSGTTTLANQFYTCYKLERIILPYSVTSVVSMVYYTYNLKRLIIPNNVNSVPSLHDNQALQEVVIPSNSSITRIPSDCFRQATQLKSVNIPASVTEIGDSAFYYCYGLKEIKLNPNITTIGTYAFSSNKCLKTVNTLGSITKVNQYTFMSSGSLQSIEIPNTVTSIEQGSFSGCHSLSKITIPSGVTSIAAQAFSYCYGLIEIHLKPTTPPTLANTNAFTRLNGNCIIYVPRSTDQTVLNAYKTASNWSTYASKMQEEPE